MQIKKYTEAIQEMRQMKEDGFNPKLLWDKLNGSWYVSYIWSPKMQNRFVRILNPQL